LVAKGKEGRGILVHVMKTNSKQEVHLRSFLTSAFTIDGGFSFALWPHYRSVNKLQYGMNTKLGGSRDNGDILKLRNCMPHAGIE